MGILVYRDRDGARDLIGRIDHEQGESGASFAYDSTYVSRATAAGELGISELLPLDSAPYNQDEIGPFFRGLLPEGEVYGNLSEYYQVPRSDYLSILEQLGCESIGSLTFISETVDPSEYNPRYEPIESETVQSLLANPARMATSIASSTRLSLSGAQSKVAWMLPKNIQAESSSIIDWLVPRGSAPSTHIIKISRRGEEDVSTNELACSLLASACGIDTAKISEMTELPGVIAVERYDRKWISANEKEKVVRLHQEDFCQALGMSPFLKYQPESVQANYPALAADLIEATSENPQADKLEFAKRLVFCYAGGNSDAHFKNFSLLYNREWTARRLAPLYDVTCIPLTGYSTAMPFDVGEHRALGDIDERDITILAADLEVGLDDFDAAVRAVINTFETPSIENSPKHVSAMVDRILDNARPRVKVLKRFLG